MLISLARFFAPYLAIAAITACLWLFVQTVLAALDSLDSTNGGR